MARNHNKHLSIYNKDHPVARLNIYHEELRRKYQSLSTKSVSELVYHYYLQLSEGDYKTSVRFIERAPRHKMLHFLMFIDEMTFKQEWKRVNGWDFNDVYDKDKFQEHLKKSNAEQATAAVEQFNPAPDLGPARDLTKIWTPAGNEITKEAFDNLGKLEGTKQMQQEIRAYNLRHLGAVTKHGYAGVLPGANGMIVDRRWREHRLAIPIQKNAMLGSPAPKELPLVDAETPAKL